eukprot:5452390-Amphidinium_carterae.2
MKEPKGKGKGKGKAVEEEESSEDESQRVARKGVAGVWEKEQTDSREMSAFPCSPRESTSYKKRQCTPFPCWMCYASMVFLMDASH